VRVAARLVWSGVALPAAGLLLAFGFVDRRFDQSLRDRLDQALMQQAAVETVSLFDRPSDPPHLHLGESHLAQAVRDYAPTGGIYRDDGTLLAQYPSVAWMPSHVAPLPLDRPRLTTEVPPEAPEELRILTVSVLNDIGDRRPYTLRLAVSLASVRDTLREQRRAALEAGGLLLVVLVAAQLWVARGFTFRLRRLAAQLPSLRQGALALALPPDAGGDEISELRDALALALDRLRTAQLAQERLLANAAHELRTPLGLIRTEIDLGLRRDRSPEELRRALADTREEVDRLSHLCSSLLDFAALGKLDWRLEPGDVCAVVRQAAAAFSADAGRRGLRFALDLPEGTTAPFDAQSLRRSVDNLLSNAIKYAPAGSAISVRVAAAGGAAQIEVADEGPGIPPEERERIFEPFHRAPGAAAGAGLGLAIVREIARRHGGSVQVVGERPGARFRLELPGATVAPAAAAPPQGP
jgi:signal transduction histidine kinase